MNWGTALASVVAVRRSAEKRSTGAKARLGSSLTRRGARQDTGGERNQDPTHPGLGKGRQRRLLIVEAAASQCFSEPAFFDSAVVDFGQTGATSSVRQIGPPM
jgi:hypothetical protein